MRKQEIKKANDLIKIENFVNYNQILKVDEKVFEKLMFIYSIAVRELETKIEILKDEFKIFYDYNLIDHIDGRIKEPKSIIHKMKQKN